MSGTIFSAAVRRAVANSAELALNWLLQSMLVGLISTRIRWIAHTLRSLSTRASHPRPVGITTAVLLSLGVAGLSAISALTSRAYAADVVGDIAKSGTEPLLVSGRVVDTDGEPVARAVVTIETLSILGKLVVKAATDADGKFKALIAVKIEDLRSMRIQASDSTGGRMGYYRFPFTAGPSPKLDALEVKLLPTRNARIKVVDAEGNPVASANVAIQFPRPHTLGGISTDGAGICSFSMPESERIGTVVAWKDQMGLDYRSYELARGQEADENARPREFPSEGVEVLTLGGAAPLTVVLRDDQHRPLDGLTAYPWLLKKDSEPQQLNLGGFFDLFRARSDAEGKINFQWMPAWQKTPIQVWPIAPQFAHTRGAYDPLSGTGVLEMELNRLVPIRGRVTDPDGRPAVGIAVSASGDSYLIDHGKANAITDKEGRYELLVPPNQLYLAIVRDKAWAAAPQDALLVLKGQVSEGKDFQLRKATRVFGHLVEEDSQQPIVNQIVFVYQYGRDLQSLGIQLPNPEGSRKWIQPVQVSTAKTDERGHFKFMLGDGNFDIRPPRQEKAEKFEINGQAELEFRVSTKLEEEVELGGKVVRKSDQSLIAHAELEGASRASRGHDWRATAKADGTFRVKRFRESTYIHAVDSENKLAGITEIDANARSVTVELQPVGSVTARLLTTDSKGPMPGEKISYGVRVHDQNERTWSYRFGGEVITDGDGKFRLEKLVPGVDYTLSLATTPEGLITTLTTLQVTPGKTRDLKDLPAPAPLKR